MNYQFIWSNSIQIEFPVILKINNFSISPIHIYPSLILLSPALHIYNLGCERVTQDQELQLKMWYLLLVRTGEMMGGDVARSVLEKALQNLPEGDGIVKVRMNGLYEEI
jgi:hypothetical protein